jgi:MSHA biogenesis protein MshJ
MKARWTASVKRLNSLSQRDRVMVFAVGAALILAFFYFTGIAPDLERRKLVAARMADQAGQLAAAETQREELTRGLAQDPDALVHERIAEKRREMAELDSQLAGLQQTLVAPDRMAAVLEQLVGADQKIRLVSLRNLPARPLAPQTEPDSGATAAQRVYKHGVEIVVEGSYLDLLAYVTRLERQPWQVYWGKTVMSANYPSVMVSLTLYTLSLDRSWLVV